MNEQFNLLTEPFIPCLALDGQARTLSIRDALARSHELREIRDKSPLVTVALHRLLLAILHRCFGPSDLDAWEAIWAAGHWDEHTLNRYLDRWHDRFDLFSGERPFLQTAGMETKSPLPAVSLFDEHSSGHNPTLFDHATDAEPVGLSPADAARGLIARQNYAVGGGQSPTCIIRGTKFKPGNRRDSPLARGLSILMCGNNLFETLLSNLALYPSDRHEEEQDEDLPLWEREDPEEIMHRKMPAGRLDLYTWQSRRLRLIPEEVNGQIVTRRVHFAQGRVLDESVRDPMKPYYFDADRGVKQFRMSTIRHVWRDSAALFQLAKEPDLAPAAITCVSRAIDAGILPVHRRHTMAVCGTTTEPGQATILAWAHHVLPLPLHYLDDEDLVDHLQRSLELAEDLGESYRQCVCRLSRRLLFPAADVDKRLSAPQRKEVEQMVGHFGRDRPYWVGLEIPFLRFLEDLPGDWDHQEAVRLRWARLLVRHVLDTFDQACVDVEGTGRHLRAQVEAKGRLVGEVKQRIEKTYQWKEVMHGDETEVA